MLLQPSPGKENGAWMQHYGQFKLAAQLRLSPPELFYGFVALATRNTIACIPSFELPQSAIRGKPESLWKGVGSKVSPGHQLPVSSSYCTMV